MGRFDGWTEKMKGKKTTSTVSKYKNIITEQDGLKFHSKKEAKRYRTLQSLVMAGEIGNLERQPRFELQEKFELDGIKYRSIVYKGDFIYFDIKEDRTVIEDVKSHGTLGDKVYKIKKKLFLKKYGDKYMFKEYN